jgi:transposase-like protein
MSTAGKVRRRFEDLRSGRWTPADARRVLEAIARSGDSTAGFAREHGLSPERIRWWRQRLREDGGRANPSPDIEFAPVVVTGIGGAAVVVRVGEIGIEVGDPSRVTVEWIAALVDAMRRS